MQSRIALTACLVASCWAGQAWAWDYQEHNQVTCAAVQTVCSALVKARATLDAAPPPAPETPRSEGDAVALRQRFDLLVRHLCRNPCADNPIVQSPTAGVTLPFFHVAFDSCRYGFGDVVALIDNRNEVVSLDDVPCAEIPKLLGQVNTAWEAAVADEHFAPANRSGIRHAEEIAEARMTFARSRTNPTLTSDPSGRDRAIEPSARQKEAIEELRKALIAAARVLHLLEDAYAAGHNATRLDNGIPLRNTTVIHNRYNKAGLYLHLLPTNDRSWRAFGDGHYKDDANAENAARMIDATTKVLCSLANSYLGTDSPVLDCPAGGEWQRIDALIPERDDGPIDETGALQLGAAYSFTSYVWESPAVYHSAFHTVTLLAFEAPLTSKMRVFNPTLRLGLDYEWYVRRAASYAAVVAGEHQHASTRSVGGHLGFGMESKTLFRLFQWGASIDVQAGAVTAAIGSSNPAAWFDGLNAKAYIEVLAYYAALRVGVNAGWRRSALDIDGFDFNLGPTVAVSALFP